MAYQTQYGNYVKFLRGTPTAWANILDSEKNADTLYFIAEPGSDTGKLFLGSKLIAGGDRGPIQLALSELTDVLIKAGIQPNSVLVYDAQTKTWVDKPLSEAISTVVSDMMGATPDTDGVHGLVPAPKAGDQNLFLQGNGAWANPTAGLQKVVDTLVGVDTGLSVREIVLGETNKIIGGAPEAYDTLKEIATWIETHENAFDIAAIESKIINLENIVVNGTDNREGLLPNVDKLNEAVFGVEGVKPGLITKVDTLNKDMTIVQANITNLQSAMTTVQGDITEIKGALRWQDILE